MLDTKRRVIAQIIVCQGMLLWGDAQGSSGGAGGLAKGGVAEARFTKACSAFD